jgi:hypothetical protein
MFILNHPNFVKPATDQKRTFAQGFLALAGLILADKIGSAQPGQFSNWNALAEAGVEVELATDASPLPDIGWSSRWPTRVISG